MIVSEQRHFLITRLTDGEQKQRDNFAFEENKWDFLGSRCSQRFW